MESGNRILLVEDNPTNVEIIEEALEENYCLKVATTGEEALQVTEDFRPDLVLLDVMMPGIDGNEVCRRMRANGALRHTKIVMVSARAMMSEKLEGYEAGADDYLTKPFDKDELLSKIRVFLRLKSVEEMDQLKGDLLRLLSHELFTPLNGIGPSLELLLSDEDMPAQERRELLEMAHGSVQRLDGLLSKILELSAMKSGKCEFVCTDVNLPEAVQTAISVVSEKASKQGIHIREEFAASPTLSLDPQRMAKAFVALLDNAIRCSGRGSEIKVHLSNDGEEAVLSVTDQGEGIEPDFLSRVFDEFTDADPRHHSTGHGLSLALSREIVRRHHGTIGVESEKGVGTTFTVRLPLSISRPTCVRASSSSSA